MRRFILAAAFLGLFFTCTSLRDQDSPFYPPEPFEDCQVANCTPMGDPCCVGQPCNFQLLPPMVAEEKTGAPQTICKFDGYCVPEVSVIRRSYSITVESPEPICAQDGPCADYGGVK